MNTKKIDSMINRLLESDNIKDLFLIDKSLIDRRWKTVKKELDSEQVSWVGFANFPKFISFELNPGTKHNKTNLSCGIFVQQSGDISISFTNIKKDVHGGSYHGTGLSIDDRNKDGLINILKSYESLAIKLINIISSIKFD